MTHHQDLPSNCQSRYVRLLLRLWRKSMAMCSDANPRQFERDVFYLLLALCVVNIFSLHGLLLHLYSLGYQMKASPLIGHVPLFWIVTQSSLHLFSLKYSDLSHLSMLMSCGSFSIMCLMCHETPTKVSVTS